MKYSFALIFCLLTVLTCAGYTGTPALIPEENAMTVTMNINDQQFVVRLHDNPAAEEFVNALPLQLGMDELNGNEKFAYLPYALPSDPVRPGVIEAGDLMLYGTHTLVLFYESFESTYRYTPVGKVANPENLPAVMGRKRVWVGFNDD